MKCYSPKEFFKMFETKQFKQFKKKIDSYCDKKLAFASNRKKCSIKSELDYDEEITSIKDIDILLMQYPPLWTNEELKIYDLINEFSNEVREFIKAKNSKNVKFKVLPEISIIQDFETLKGKVRLYARVLYSV